MDDNTSYIIVDDISDFHCVKSVCIWSYSGPYFTTFGLNTERYGVSLRIQSKSGKMQTRITPNTDTFHAVLIKPLEKASIALFQSFNNNLLKSKPCKCH